MKCPICFESFKSEKKVVSTQCGHLIHDVCIQKWLNTGTNTCPKCRTPIPNRNKLVKMYLSSSDEMSETEETPEQGNLLVGIVNWSGAARSLEYRKFQFSFCFHFNIQLKTVFFTNNVGHIWFPLRKYFLEKVLDKKICH